MELKEIVSEMATGLQRVDKTTDTQNSANAETSTYGNYLKGVGCLGEHQFRDELMEWWNHKHSSTKFAKEQKYPENGRWKCDITLFEVDPNTTLRINDSLDWAIELKYIRFIGDNGKVNNYGLGKVVSPYKAEHSSVGDAIRLSGTEMGKRKAVVMYGFEFDQMSVEHCRQLLREMELPEVRANEMEKAIRNGTHDGQWNLELVAPIFEAACASMDVSLGERVVVNFSGLTRHPNYRFGRFLAWEVLGSR